MIALWGDVTAVVGMVVLLGLAMWLDHLAGRQAHTYKGRHRKGREEPEVQLLGPRNLVVVYWPVGDLINPDRRAMLQRATDASAPELRRRLLEQRDQAEQRDQVFSREQVMGYMAGVQDAQRYGRED